MIKNSLYPVSGFTHPCSSFGGSHPSNMLSPEPIPESSFYLTTCLVCGATRREARYTRGGGYRSRLSNGLAGSYPRR